MASVRVDGPTRTVTLTDGRELSAHALLVASGMKVRRNDPDLSTIVGLNQV